MRSFPRVRGLTIVAFAVCVGVVVMALSADWSYEQRHEQDYPGDAEKHGGRRALPSTSQP